MSDAARPWVGRVECVVEHPDGMHAVPCTRLARTVGRFRCDVRVEWDGKFADAKSVLELMRLTAPHGALLKFLAEGSDAQRCLDAVSALMAVPHAS